MKFTFKEQKEYEVIDDEIAGLEGAIQELEAKISEASSDYTLLQQLLAEKEVLEKQLEQKMDRWVYLNELAEKIANQNNSWRRLGASRLAFEIKNVKRLFISGINSI
ncbi:MAG: ABC transporter C-terminal domain-containing protein [Caulobacteraceae bacterium]